MSKGLPKDKNVTKPRPKRRRAQGTEAGSAAINSGLQDATSDNKCLRGFKAELSLSNPESLKLDDPITLVKDSIDHNKIIVIQNGTSYGEYSGQNKQMLLACMKLGYTYQGKLIRITAAGAAAEIRGEGA